MDLIFGNIFHKLEPTINRHIGKFYRVDCIRLDLPYGVSTVVLSKVDFDYGNNYTCFMEIPCCLFVIASRIFHKHTGLTEKAFQEPCQFLEFTLGVTDIAR